MNQKNIVFIFLYSLYISFICVSSKFVKNISLLNNKGLYLNKNISFIMNLKERGITVGDLLIILIIIITSSILIKSFSKDKKTTLNYSNQEQITYKKNYHQKLI